MAVKGGTNQEPHNHNDVGSFFYVLGSDMLLEDLGAGEYTADYFGEKRYHIFCNSSFSHNVPILCGMGQYAGDMVRPRTRAARPLTQGLLRQAGFPAAKNLDDYDWSRLKTPADRDRAQLEILEFIDHVDDLVLYGNVGCGKTHLAPDSMLVV